jgi:hypothetical protein
MTRCPCFRSEVPMTRMIWSDHMRRAAQRCDFLSPMYTCHSNGAGWPPRLARRNDLVLAGIAYDIDLDQS